MKVLLFGATGRIGRHLLAQGLARGHEITVLVRHPEKLGPVQSRVRVVVGDALEARAVERAVTGQKAVVYALGSRRLGPTTLFSESTRLLLRAMEKQGVKRLVCITGVGAGETKGHGGFLYDHLIFPLFTQSMYADKDRQEALIRQSSLDWILVRPAVFREGVAPGPLQVVTEVQGVTLRRIAPAEVARFVLEQLESDQYLRKTPFLGHV